MGIENMFGDIDIKYMRDTGKIPPIDYGLLHLQLTIADSIKDEIHNNLIKLLSHIYYDIANINARDKAGRTALMLASMSCYSEIVKELLEKGADVNLKDKDGKTALDYARNMHIRKILKTAGAKELTLLDYARGIR